MNLLHTFQNPETETLNNSLSEFGLRPSDWSLIEEQKSFFKIQNKDAPEFYFHGKTQVINGEKRWVFIRLAGV